MESIAAFARKLESKQSAADIDRFSYGFKMVGIPTGRAAAKVVELKAVRKVTSVILPRCAVDVDNATTSTATLDHAMSSGTHGAEPYPAVSILHAPAFDAVDDGDPFPHPTSIYRVG